MTSDLDVLEATLSVLLRPAQQYTSQTPFEPGQGANVSQRLLTLAKGWEKYKGQGWDLATLASVDELVLPDILRRLSIQFYPVVSYRPSSPESEKGSQDTPTRKPTSSKSSRHPHPASKPEGTSGLIVFEIDNILPSTSDSMQDRLSSFAEENHMSAVDQLIALNQLRLTTLSHGRKQRRQLLTVRLLAFAVYGKSQIAIVC